MRVEFVRVLVIPAACLVWLAGCETSTKLGDMWKSGSGTGGDVETTGSLKPADAPPGEGALFEASPKPPKFPGEPMSPSSAALLGSSENDDLTTAKKYFYQGSYGLAEKHFRRAVELHPRDAESWVGLAASYDRLRRFDLADRAYQQAFGLLGPTPEMLNNQGFSYLLRGDYPRARDTLLKAQSLDPKSPYIRNNLLLLKKAVQRAKGVD